MKKETWRENKLNYLRYFYEDIIERNGFRDCHDDRRVCVNIYDMIIKAINNVRSEPYCYVAVAMDDKIKKDCDLMNKIIYRFHDLNKIVLEEHEVRWFTRLIEAKGD